MIKGTHSICSELTHYPAIRINLGSHRVTLDDSHVVNEAVRVQAILNSLLAISI